MSSESIRFNVLCVYFEEITGTVFGFRYPLFMLAVWVPLESMVISLDKSRLYVVEFFASLVVNGMVEQLLYTQCSPQALSAEWPPMPSKLIFLRRIIPNIWCGHKPRPDHAHPLCLSLNLGRTLLLLKCGIGTFAFLLQPGKQWQSQSSCTWFGCRRFTHCNYNWIATIFSRESWSETLLRSHQSLAGLRRN